ncbi:MAG: autotransporter-associated beta strand repeat-containing protein [Luteolibacter sp.]|uniref:autotransporter-associated beta strand repeat-containing protein n=1 Tax=Luteolibacter sp. TaxID=1962973 RepID=UPI0032678F2C
MKTRRLILSVCGRFALVSLSSCLFLGLQKAGASDLYWDLNAAASNSGTSATGTWNTSNVFWNADNTGGAGGSTTATTAAADNLFFSSGTGYTSTSSVISVSGTRSANSLTFEEGTITMRSTGTIAFGTGTSEINVASSRTANINSLVSGSNGLIKTGAGVLFLGTTLNDGTSGGIYNSGLTGDIVIKAGTLVAGSFATNQNATNGQLISLGDTDIGASAAATFSINRNQNYNSAITVNSGSSGVKRLSGGSGLSVVQTPTITGAITLNDHLTIGNGSGGSVGGVNLSGAITGSKTITIDGATAYTDAATIGTIAILRGASDSSFTGNVTVNRGIVKIGSTGAIGTGTAVVSTAAGSALDLSNGANSFSISVAGLNNGSTTGGTVTNLSSGTTTAVLSVAGSGTYSYGGVIADGATAKVGLTVNLTGSGSQTLTNTNSYTGATTVSAGTLFLNGSLAAGTATSVGGTATVAGTGTFNGVVTVDGTAAPGNNVAGTLNFANDLALNGNYAWEIGANSTVSGFDKLAIAGAGNVTLGGSSTLSIATLAGVDFLDSFWTASQSWKVIDNNGSGAVTGTFAALSGITSNSYGAFSLGYGSGSGSDVTLNWIPAAVPEPSAAALAVLGGLALVRRRRD